MLGKWTKKGTTHDALHRGTTESIRTLMTASAFMIPTLSDAIIQKMKEKLLKARARIAMKKAHHESLATDQTRNDKTTVKDKSASISEDEEKEEKEELEMLFKKDGFTEKYSNRVFFPFYDHFRYQVIRMRCRGRLDRPCPCSRRVLKKE